MGGNAVKSAQRMDKQTFDQYVAEVVALFPELKMSPVKSFRQKESFGDIDIVVEMRPGINIKNLIRATVKPHEEYDNGPYYSFLYKTAQVDFIMASPDEFAMTCEYMNWNDIGNFFGRVARSMNFKYGHDGLSYEKHLDDHYKISVLISNDITKILPFLGYDYERWTKGFDTEDEIFAYAASSPYFNPLYFDLLEQNHNDRVRNKKRKMYQKMLAYIQEHKFEGRPKLTEFQREQHYLRAIQAFGNVFDTEVQIKIKDYDKHLLFKSRFNGDIVSKATGLIGKELGQFMQWMNANYPNLREWINESVRYPEEVQGFIQKAFKYWK